jgi:hypothetical protein
MNMRLSPGLPWHPGIYPHVHYQKPLTASYWEGKAVLAEASVLGAQDLRQPLLEQLAKNGPVWVREDGEKAEAVYFSSSNGGGLGLGSETRHPVVNDDPVLSHKIRRLETRIRRLRTLQSKCLDVATAVVSRDLEEPYQAILNNRDLGLIRVNGRSYECYAKYGGMEGYCWVIAWGFNRKYRFEKEFA